MDEKTPDSQSSLVSLADERRVAALVGESVLRLWEVVHALIRLRPSRRDDFRVTIFGSARIPRDHWVYRTVHDLPTWRAWTAR